MIDLPVFAEGPIPGVKRGYAPASELFAAWQRGDVARAWRLGHRLVSVQMNKAFGAGIWKAHERLLHPDGDALLRSLDRIGVEHPSSFADCYHQLADKPRRLPWTINGIFAGWPGGPWSEARRKGQFGGAWWRYDLQSAYRWAATERLPALDSLRVVTSRKADRPGLWLVETQEDRPDLPRLYQQRGQRVIITEDEIGSYNLKCRTLRGVIWDAELAPDHVERVLTQLPCAKEAGRAYWGRWIAKDPLICWTPKGESTLRNDRLNFVWGWLIVSRVRHRVWSYATLAAHVYVDEILVPHELPTGTIDGAWRLKQHYPDGVWVRRTGHFGDARTTSMATGVRRIAANN